MGGAQGIGKDTILDADGKGSLQINRQTLQGTFTSYGERGAYRLKLADGSGATQTIRAATLANLIVSTTTTARNAAGVAIAALRG